MKVNRHKLTERIQFWSFISPALLILLFVCIIPLFTNFYYALYDWNGVSSNKLFIGLENFSKLFNDPKFLRSIKFSARYAVYFLVLVNILAMTISIVLAGSSKRLSNIGRASYYIPCITASAASGLMWRFIFRNGTDTIYNLTGIEIFSKSWIGSVDLSFYSILIVGVWGAVGFYVIIYVAALLSVPNDILEAASIDGASHWKRFWKITLPQIAPTFSTCILLSLIDGFKVFDSIMLITSGGPAGMTTSMAYGIYTTAFTNFSYGLASAKAIIFFAVLLILTVIHLSIPGYSKRQ